MDEIDVIFSNIEVSLFCNAEEICVVNQEIYKKRFKNLKSGGGNLKFRVCKLCLFFL